jgi:hypothetical protein
MYAVTYQAAKYLADLAAEGLLPWLEDGEGGRLEVGPAHLTEVVYPVARTFTLKKRINDSVCYYQVVKQSREAEWTLQTAWWVDAEGKVISAWP